MKRNIFENEKIDYIENENEAIEYLKQFDYHSSVLMHEDKTFSLNSIKIHDFFMSDGVLRLKIKDCYGFDYVRSQLSSNTTYPQECYLMNIISCDVKKGTNELKINTSCDGIFHFDLVSNGNVLNVQDSSTYANTTCFVVQNSDFKKIIYNTTKTKTNIKIENCNNISRFIDLILPENVLLLEIIGSKISSFEHFDTKVKNVFKFDTRHIKNFLHSDKIVANELVLIMYNTFDNITNVIINNDCEVISFFYNARIQDENNELVDILAKYINMNKDKRVNSIMDCALELIDAGFEKAAEL